MQPRSGPPESGQILVLTTFLMLALLLVAGIAVDAGYGFVQMRRAQNAADFAAQAATDTLMPVCSGAGSVSNAQVSAVIAQLVAANASSAAGDWVASYRSATGAAIAGVTLPAQAGSAPQGACGVKITVRPGWRPFFAELIGVERLFTAASAQALLGDNPSAAPVGQWTGIVALAPSGGHTILGGGSGEFVVNGNIMDNSVGKSNAEGYADTVDDFQNSSTVINGQLDSVAANPLDPCFYPAGATSATCASHTSGTVTYTGGIHGGLAPVTDPLAYVPTPVPGDAACPPSDQAATDPSPVGGDYLPGVYTYPVVITGTATLEDCGGFPGVYIFQDGVAICPAAGDTVSGTDVMLYSTYSGPVSTTGCGTGSGSSGPGGPGRAPGPGCSAGPGPGGAGARHQSMYIGGQGTVDLSGPATGPYAHVVLYQERTVPADIGLDTGAGDSAAISIQGAVYDSAFGNGSGGKLVSGQSSSCGGTAVGSIRVDGIVVVASFDTQGTASVVITYDPSQVPGAGAVLDR